MILTDKAKRAINKETGLRLAIALGFTELWVTRLRDQNKENGPLTTAKALQVIREATGLQDSEILQESEPINALK